MLVLLIFVAFVQVEHCQLKSFLVICNLQVDYCLTCHLRLNCDLRNILAARLKYGYIALAAITFLATPD